MSNIINTSSIPFVFTYLNTSLTNVAGNGMDYTVLFDTVLSGSGYSTSTGLYTVPITGNYFIAVNIFFNNLVSGANDNLTTLKVTGKYDFRISKFSMTALKDPSNNFVTNGCVSDVLLTAGDTVFIDAFINNGSSKVVGITGGTSPYTTWMFIKYLP